MDRICGVRTLQT